MTTASSSIGSAGHPRSAPSVLGAPTLWAAILAVAFALRWAGLGAIEFGLDEYYAILTADSPAGILHTLRNDPNPPLYFYILRGWMAAFGDSEMGARSLSVVCGVAFVAALGGWVRQFAVERSAPVWAMTVAALSPIQVYHSQQARAYALLVLLITLNFWSLWRAVRRGGAGRWLLYGASALAALYTHNQFLPLVPAAWLMVWAAGARRREFAVLGIVQGALAVFYAPWFLVVLRQSDPAALEWIVSFWRRTPPLLAIPRSLEVMGIGGRLPRYYENLSGTPGDAVRAVSIVWSLVLGLAVLHAAWRDRDAPTRVRRPAVFLAVALFAPLAFQFSYSVLKHPIYLVGRYDCVAHPAYLALAGFGMAFVQAALARRLGLLAWLGPLGVTAVLAAFALAPRYRPAVPPEMESLRYRDRLTAAALGKVTSPDDLVVCLGYGGAAILYEQRHGGFAGRVTTFPSSTMDHLGWMNPRLALEPDDAALRQEARDLFEYGLVRRVAEGSRPAVDREVNGPEKIDRVWIALDEATVTAIQEGQREHPLARIANLFFDEARAAGWRIGRPAEEVADVMFVLGVYQLERGPGAAR